MDYNLEEVLLYIILPGKTQTVVFNMPGNVCLETSLLSNFLNAEGLQLVNCRKVKIPIDKFPKGVELLSTEQCLAVELNRLH